MIDDFAKRQARRNVLRAKEERKRKYPYGMMNKPMRVSNGLIVLSKAFAEIYFEDIMNIRDEPGMKGRAAGSWRRALAVSQDVAILELAIAEHIDRNRLAVGSGSIVRQFDEWLNTNFRLGGPGFNIIISKAGLNCTPG